jgi:hypothetical protein
MNDYEGSASINRRLMGYQRTCRAASRTARCIGSGWVFSLCTSACLQDNLSSRKRR